jgi:hypothetical protein
MAYERFAKQVAHQARPGLVAMFIAIFIPTGGNQLHGMNRVTF